MENYRNSSPPLSSLQNDGSVSFWDSNASRILVSNIQSTNPLSPSPSPLEMKTKIEKVKNEDSKKKDHRKKQKFASTSVYFGTKKNR